MGMQDFVHETLANKDVKKKMSPTNAKALNTMRQRLKKHNVLFTDQINKYRENPASTEEEEEEEEEKPESEDSEDGGEDVGDEGFETKQVSWDVAGYPQGLYLL